MRKPLRVGVMASLMVLTFALTTAMASLEKPMRLASSIDLEAMVPTAFGDWKSVPLIQSSVVNPQQDALAAQIYTQTLTRLYRDQVSGQRVMLVIAYGADQRDNLQVHYPEVCYPAQGFEVQSNNRVLLPTAYGELPVRQMKTRLHASRNEPVTYWAMLGDTVVLDGMHKKIAQMRMAWEGQRADGLLFRVSSIDEQNARGFATQSHFIAELMAALPAAQRHRLSGL